MYNGTWMKGIRLSQSDSQAVKDVPNAEIHAVLAYVHASGQQRESVYILVCVCVRTC